MYPSLMIEYGYLSRNVVDKEKFREVRDARIKFKKENNPIQKPLKLIINGTFGAMKEKHNGLYDPLQANNVCIAGQLLLLDLIEKVEDYCELIQTNTDGLILKVDKDFETIKRIAKEWETRTRLNLEWDRFSKVYQKDVNNYIIIREDGSYKSIGAYVKKLSNLDNDLPIVNKALVNFFVSGIKIEETIKNCKDLMQFQKIVKINNTYITAMYGDEILKEKVLRVFASKRKDAKGIFKMKSPEKADKVANTADKCFIFNENVKGMKIPEELDLNWYIDLANRRLKQFIGG